MSLRSLIAEFRPALLCLAFAVASTPTAYQVRAEPAFDEHSPVRKPFKVASHQPETIEPAISPDVATATPKPERPIVLVVGGDLGLGGSDQPVSSKGAYRQGARYAWTDLTSNLARHINGDINFANLETVVTPKNGLGAAAKKFRFKSHPAGVRHLVKLGFNAFSLANNHAIDYGRTGMKETLRHLMPIKSNGLEMMAGLGYGSAALQPSLATVREATFALSAIGIGGVPARNGQIGMASYRSEQDLAETIRRLSASGGEYKILSVHYNTELNVRPIAKDAQRLRELAVMEHGIDLVVGHHAHVAAGVQRVGDKFIFYGMGNLLHPGMQNMARFNRCRDYGLLGRLHLMRRPDGRLVAGAIEVVALRDMHLNPRARIPREGQRRIEVLNVLAAGLDVSSSKATGVRFRARKDGSGLYCTEKGARAGGDLGKLCAGWTPPDPPSRSVLASVRHACGGVRGRTIVAAGKKPRRSAQAGRAAARKRARMRRLAARLYEAEN